MLAQATVRLKETPVIAKEGPVGAKPAANAGGRSITLLNLLQSALELLSRLLQRIDISALLLELLPPFDFRTDELLVVRQWTRISAQQAMVRA
jgi:hypothetical protein